MSCHRVLLLVAYFGLLQCDLYESAPVKLPPTIVQLRLPFSYMDGFPIPYSTFVNNKQQYGNNGRYQPNAVKISIPTPTKSGRTNIIIDTRKLPNNAPDYNCPPPINDKTNVNVYVELKTNKDDKKDSQKNSNSSASAAETSASTKKTKNLIESKSSTKSHSKTLDKEVDVLVNIDQVQNENNDEGPKEPWSKKTDDGNNNKAGSTTQKPNPKGDAAAISNSGAISNGNSAGAGSGAAAIGDNSAAAAGSRSAATGNHDVAAADSIAGAISDDNATKARPTSGPSTSSTNKPTSTVKDNKSQGDKDSAGTHTGNDSNSGKGNNTPAPSSGSKTTDSNDKDKKSQSNQGSNDGDSSAAKPSGIQGSKDNAATHTTDDSSSGKGNTDKTKPHHKDGASAPSSVGTAPSSGSKMTDSNNKDKKSLSNQGSNDGGSSAAKPSGIQGSKDNVATHTADDSSSGKGNTDKTKPHHKDGAPAPSSVGTAPSPGSKTTDSNDKDKKSQSNQGSNDGDSSAAKPSGIQGSKDNAATHTADDPSLGKGNTDKTKPHHKDGASAPSSVDTAPSSGSKTTNSNDKDKKSQSNQGSNDGDSSAAKPSGIQGSKDNAATHTADDSSSGKGNTDKTKLHHKDGAPAPSSVDTAPSSGSKTTNSNDKDKKAEANKGTSEGDSSTGKTSGSHDSTVAVAPDDTLLTSDDSKYT